MEQPINFAHAERRLYSQEDVKTILEQATGVGGKSFTYEHLEEMAEELGISPHQLQAAKEVWLAEQQKLIKSEKMQEKKWKAAIMGLAFVLGMGLIAMVLYLAYLTHPFLFAFVVLIGGLFVGGLFFFFIETISKL